MYAYRLSLVFINRSVTEIKLSTLTLATEIAHIRKSSGVQKRDNKRSNTFKRNKEYKLTRMQGNYVRN